MSRSTKYLVRNDNGSILGKYDTPDEATDFYKKHAAARYLEKVTVSSEIMQTKKRSVLPEITFDEREWL